MANDLHPDHRADLEKSGISEDTRLANGVYTCAPRDISKKLGYSNGVTSLLCFPYPGIDGFERVKPFPVKPNNQKYHQPKESGNHLYIPTKTRELLTDPSQTIIITEGEKKALCGSERGLAAIGLSGLWGWSRGEKKLIDDFNHIDWKGRKVAIVPDNDYKSPSKHGYKTNLVQAVSELRERLRVLGAKVTIIELPPGLEKGLDDFLVAHGVEKFLSLTGADAEVENDEAPEEPSVKPPKKSQATILVDIGLKTKLFHTEIGEAFSCFASNGHTETWRVKSLAFKDFLRSQYIELKHSVPSDKAVAEAAGNVRAIARIQMPQGKVHTRIARVENTIYLDLTNENWEVVAVTSDGWEVVPSPADVHFRRGRGMLPMPKPQHGGNLTTLMDILNLGEQDGRALIVAWLIGCYLPHGPYPILVIVAPQGSGKSILAKIIRLIADPNDTPLKAPPRNERDLYIAATNSLVLAYDNLSGLPDWLSDAFCRISTGGGFSTRENYSDDEEINFSVTKPIVLNGIDSLFSRMDLADRAILISPPPIPPEKVISEKELMEKFQIILPSALGRLLDGVSTALRNEGKVQLTKLPRMADFAMWVSQAEPEMTEVGNFLQAYENNRYGIVEKTVQEDPVGEAIIDFMRDKESWSGTPTELLTILKLVKACQYSGDTWPKDPPRLSKKLVRLQAFLGKLEIEVGESRSHGKRFINLKKTGNGCR